MADLTGIFDGGVFSIREHQVLASPEEQLRDAIIEAGLEPPDAIHIDGKIHRFRAGTKGSGGRGDKTGWYICFPDGVPAGRFGCWRAGIELSWKANLGRQLSPAEEMAITRRMEEARAERDADLERDRNIISIVVDKIWSEGLGASPDHPYLKRKGIGPNGARVTGDGRLMVPAYDQDGTINSIQYIDPNGVKSYHQGGQAKNSFWVLGNISKDETFYISEGFATAATIHEVTGKACVIAYSASNLVGVTEIMRSKYGMAQDIAVVADNDRSGAGIAYAKKASEKYGVRVIMPPVFGDANDYMLAGNDLMALLEPPRDSGWLIPADEFCQEPSPIKWILKGWLPEESLVMVHGPSGCGKSFFVIDACAHIASGMTEWLGHKSKHGCVVYLAGEGHHGMRGRLAAWKHHHQAGSLNMFISREGLDLNTPDGYQRVIDALIQVPESPKVIVVDTLNRFLSGDENSAEDTKTMLDACNALMRRFNCTVILVHHTGVAENAQHRARGSSAWKGALDIEISVAPSSDGGPIEIIQRKNKDAELSADMYVRLAQVTIPGWLDEDGSPVTSAVITQADKEKKSLKMDGKTRDAVNTIRNAFAFTGTVELRGGLPYITRSSISRYLSTESGYSDSTINKHLAPHGQFTVGLLMKHGLIAKEGDGFVVVDDRMQYDIMGSDAAQSMLAEKQKTVMRTGFYDER